MGDEKNKRGLLGSFMASAGRFIMDALGDTAEADREIEQEHYVGADAPLQGETEEEAALRKKNGAAIMARAVKEDEAERRKKENAKRRMAETEWGAFHRRWILGIKDHHGSSPFLERGFAHGPYVSLVPAGKINPYTKERDVSDAQILAIIAKLVLEKGYNELYCYKGSAIDPYLTSRMNKMLQLLKEEGKILEGHQVMASNMRFPGAEPWRGWWLGRMSDKWRSMQGDWRSKVVIPYHMFKLDVATNDMLGKTDWVPRMPKMKDITPPS